MANVTINKTLRRKRRVSSNITGTAERPRIAVHRSGKYIYAQAIDDAKRVTLAAASSLKIRLEAKKKAGTKTDEAKQVGMELAKKLMDKKVDAGVFDRGRFTYNGRVKALAEGLREAGLKI